MSDKARIKLTFFVLTTVFIVKVYSSEVNQFLWNDKESPHFYLSITGQVLYYLIPTVLVLLICHKKPSLVPVEMGISSGFLEGLLFGTLFTLPMLLGYAIMGTFNQEHSLIKNLVFSFKDGFREELFYRAFLFGQLFKQAKWGFLPAVAVNGVIFGLSHLYQAHNVAESLGVFALTFGGAVWFSWLFIEYRNNLWIPVFVHFLMNLSWDLWSTDQTAIGNFMLNVPRIFTILLSVFITLKWSKKKNGQLLINRSNLLRQVG